MLLFFLGRDRYSQNLELLVPFFDHSSLELEKIDKVPLSFEDFCCWISLVNVNLAKVFGSSFNLIFVLVALWCYFIS